MNTLNQEADMGYIRDFVAKIADALVAATELPKQIADIQSQMTALNSDLERTKARNIELDTLLGDTRRQRDEAEQALSQVKAQLNEAHQSLTTAENNNHTYSAQLEEFRSRLEQAKKERDDYGLKHMAAEDRANEAEAKLDKLREAMGIPKPQASPPTTPEPEPVKSTIPEAAPTTTHTGYGVALPEPSPPQAEPQRVYEGDWGFNDLHHASEQFDPIKGKWYRTA